MKLKCELHERRVMVLSKTVMHREDGSQCNSNVLHIGMARHTPGNIRETRQYDWRGKRV